MEKASTWLYSDFVLYDAPYGIMRKVIENGESQKYVEEDSAKRSHVSKNWNKSLVGLLVEMNA